MRGSLCFDVTTTCSSGEYQRSSTMLRSRSLPIWPAGMVIVVRVPWACTPSMTCVPSCSVLGCSPEGPAPFENHITLAPERPGGGGGTGASNVALKEPLPEADPLPGGGGGGAGI